MSRFIRTSLYAHTFARKRPVDLGALTKALGINAGWFAPQLTFPLAGLLEEVAPCDPVASGSLELSNVNNLMNRLVEHKQARRRKPDRRRRTPPTW